MNQEAVPISSGESVSDEETAGAAAFAGVSLPRFFMRDTDGVFVDLCRFEGADAFRRLVERLFEADGCFRGLDYGLFQRLAFELEPAQLADERAACEHSGRPARWRLADSLGPILPLRLPLYRSFRVSGGDAEYMFEPVTLDVEMEESVTDASGDRRTVTRMSSVRTALDFDEFVARAWVMGVRFGLDEAGVRRAIDEGFNGKLIIARARAATAAQDARVEEVGQGLRRDDAPNLLSDGRVNLLQFRNRFPQVRKGARLMHKHPARQGEPGRGLGGEILLPAAPRDFDLSALVGAGTQLEQDEEGEYLVATMDGFLDIDAGSGKISVTEKIISRQGVNIRTTGDISLVGEEYEEYGEIQEKRLVEGWNITAHADVYGNLSSAGGVITIKKKLSGGTISNAGGRIVVEQRALNATILGGGGEVTVRQAENCLIAGRRVVITEAAICCDILADEVEIQQAEGASVAARKTVIHAVRPRGNAETLLSVLLPALERFDRQCGDIRSQEAALDEAEQQARAEAMALKAQEPVARCLLIAGKLRRQEVVLNDEQAALFERLRQSAAPALKRLALLSRASDERAVARGALEQQLADIADERAATCAGVACRIEDIAGELIVRTVTEDAHARPYAGQSPAELRHFLHAPTAGNSLLYSGDSGRFEWHLDDAHPGR